MECRHARKKISAYLDHELDAPFVRQLELHLQGCMECRRTLEDFRGLSEEVKSLPKIDPGPDFAGRMVSAVRDPAAGGAEEAPARLSLWGRLSGVVENFMEVVSPPRSPATGALNEFNDFPPLSMGYIYYSAAKVITWSGRFLIPPLKGDQGGCAVTFTPPCPPRGGNRPVP